MPKKSCDRWKPVRRGAIYCSPACGGGCTYEAYLQATIAAHKLALQCGTGFTPRVWENLGWHYAANSKSNQIKVHPYGGGIRGYTVFFGSPDSPGGKYAIQDKSLKKALRAGFERVQKDARDTNTLLRELQHLMP